MLRLSYEELCESPRAWRLLSARLVQAGLADAGALDAGGLLPGLGAEAEPRPGEGRPAR